MAFALDATRQFVAGASAELGEYYFGVANAGRSSAMYKPIWTSSLHSSGPSAASRLMRLSPAL